MTSKDTRTSVPTKALRASADRSDRSPRLAESCRRKPSLGYPMGGPEVGPGFEIPADGTLGGTIGAVGGAIG